MSTGGTVLVIDDDRDFRESIGSLLESEGYAVDLAGSGKAGLRKLREHRPDLIVLDVMMESLVEGYSVTHAIKFQAEFEPYADIPILMVSSIAESPDERFGRSEEVEMIRPNRYMTKPLDIPVFLEEVAKAARRGAAAGS